jgi:Mat/Ecp fimbriae outer membrane usher protein
VMKTMTVIGRLVDVLGRPLKGVQVANHAGRTFTEPTGVFALELSERTPTLDISRGDEALCQLRIDRPNGSAAGEHVIAGDLICGKATPEAEQTSVSSASNDDA